MSHELAPGEMRIWKKKYFTNTPPTEGFEFFMLIERFLDGKETKWQVMFCGGSLIPMTEESILHLSRRMLERS